MKQYPLLILPSKNIFNYQQIAEIVGKLASDRNASKVIIDTLISWIIIILCFLFWNHSSSLIFKIILILIVASRQHALTIIMHDAAHGILFKRRSVGYWFSDFFCAWPLLILSTDSFAKTHLAHHKYSNSDKDPDWTTKKGLKDWSFPKKKLEFIYMILIHFLGKSIIEIFIYLKNHNKLQNKTKSKKFLTIKKSIRLFHNFIFVSLLIYFFGFSAFLILWLYSGLVVSAIFHRLRSISEHFCLDGINDLSITRSTYCSFFEGFFLSPHNINYHIEHHLYSTVPYYNLPILSNILWSDSSFVEKGEFCGGYFFSSKKNGIYLPSVISKITI